MKKIILLFFAVLSLSVVTAQSTDNQSDTAKLTKEVIYKDVKAVVKEIADALKVGTEHVYNVLVKQQVLTSITYLCVLCTFLIIALIFLYATYRCEKGNVKSSMTDEGTIYFVITVVVGIVFIFTFLSTINCIITGFVNPEYGAIKEIMNMLKPQ